MVVLWQVDAWSWLGLHLARVPRILDADKEMCAQRGMKNVHGAFPSLFLARPPPTTPHASHSRSSCCYVCVARCTGRSGFIGEPLVRSTPSILVKKNHLGQRHGLQNTTLTSYF